MDQVEAGFRALADRRRRHALLMVMDHRTVTLPDLAEYVTEREQDTDRSEITDELVRDVYFSLYHSHVPALENADLVMYDQQQDLVGATDQAVPVLTEIRDEVEALF